MAIQTIQIFILLSLITACGGGSDTISSSADDNNSSNSTLLVNRVQPSNGDLAGGTLLRISGENLNGAISVQLGNDDCTNLEVISDVELTCETPSATNEGPVSISVTNQKGETSMLEAAFTYGNPGPTLTGVTPTSYIITQGTTLTIRGTGFVGNSRSTAQVFIGGLPCQIVAVRSASEITCTTPTDSDGAQLGAQTLRVVNPDTQVAELNNAFTYRQPPTYTQLISPGGAFSSHCASCHIGGNRSGGLALDVYQDTQNFQRVVPGDFSQSVIWQRMNAVGGSIMPPAGPVPEDDLQKVEDWILDGGLNN